MKVLLATNHLGLGGSESYLLTVAEQLDRLGHEVTIFTPEPGPGVAVAEERGVPVVDEAEIPEGIEAALVQDGGVSHRIADRLPGVPQLFVAHSGMFDLQAPPQLEGEVGVVVALNERVAKRMRQFAVEVEVARLHQPIDTQRFVPYGPLPETPRIALMLSNTPHADRLETIRGACADAGLELAQLGGATGRKADVRSALAEADLVIGYGRSILEGMACGRAAYVYDWQGGDGWVTRGSYDAIEADGFAGSAAKNVLNRESLAVDLRRYSPEMGLVNRDIVLANHRAARHAEQLIDLLRGLNPPPPRAREPLREMARLVRLEWRAQLDIQSLRTENGALRQRLHESELARLEQHAELERAASQKAAAEARAEYFEGERLHLVNSFSWRLTAPLRRLATRLRAMRSR